MAKIFLSIGELLEDLFTVHIDNARLDRIEKTQESILRGQSDLSKALLVIDGKIEAVFNEQEAETSSMKGIRDDILSIKAFLGAPDHRLGATPEQVDALGKKLTSETAAVEQFDASLGKP